MIDSNQPGSGSQDSVEPGFAKLPKPAERALAQGGFTWLTQLAEVSESHLSTLSGVGPWATGRLRQALTAAGPSFAGV